MDELTLLKDHWDEILAKLKNDYEVSDVSFRTWVEPLEIKSAGQGVLTLVVPEADIGISILNKKFSKPLKVSIAEVTDLIYDIDFVSRDDFFSKEKNRRDLELEMEDAGINPKYSFDTFVVGANNKFANAAALAVAESPGDTYNPLYLYAGVGLGKTHLMQSVCHYILENNKDKDEKDRKKVLYVTSEVFTNELIEAIRSNSMQEFREKYRKIDVLAIDDIQFIIGKDATQEEFFHTFNALYESKKQIIISSDKPPKDLNILEERITSRLEMGLIADISVPDYETRMAILHRKEELEGYEIDEEILDYIAKNVKSNIRIMEGCITRIKAKSRFEKREVTLEMAEEILQDLITPEADRRITPEKIVDAVSEHFHLEPDELKSQKRDNKYLYPRKIAMYLCRNMTQASLKEVAQLLNRKDHTTVMNACRGIERDIQISDETRRDVEVLKKKIGSVI